MEIFKLCLGQISSGVQASGYRGWELIKALNFLMKLKNQQRLEVWAFKRLGNYYITLFLLELIRRCDFVLRVRNSTKITNRLKFAFEHIAQADMTNFASF